MEYEALGEYVIVEDIYKQETFLEMPDSVEEKKRNQAQDAKVLSIGSHANDLMNYDMGPTSEVKVDDIIVYDARSSFAIDKDKGIYSTNAKNLIARKDKGLELSSDGDSNTMKLEKPIKKKKKRKKKKLNA